MGHLKDRIVRECSMVVVLRVFVLALQKVVVIEGVRAVIAEAAGCAEGCDRVDLLASQRLCDAFNNSSLTSCQFRSASAPLVGICIGLLSLI
jgi:hypothetical protein